MNESIASRLLYYVHLDDKIIGLIGGTKEKLLGMRSLFILESLLMKSYRGQGLAPVMQSKFLECHRNEFKIVWGTVDLKNIPFTKSAEKIGRRAIRNEYFLPFDKFK